jgi:hypothetical protein
LSIRKLREIYKFVFSFKKRFRIVDFVFFKYFIVDWFFLVKIQSNFKSIRSVKQQWSEDFCLVQFNRCSTTRFVIFNVFAKEYLIAHLRIARIVWRKTKLKSLLTWVFIRLISYTQLFVSIWRNLAFNESTKQFLSNRL